MDGWRYGLLLTPSTPSVTYPFEVGVPLEKIISTFPAIDTNVDGIKITEGLENIAKVMNRGTLIRTHKVADLGHILHSPTPVPLAHRVRTSLDGGGPHT